MQISIRNNTVTPIVITDLGFTIQVNRDYSLKRFTKGSILTKNIQLQTALIAGDITLVSLDGTLTSTYTDFDDAEMDLFFQSYTLADYSLISHNHDLVYSPLVHNHTEYSLTTHDHNLTYSVLGHTHTDYSLITHDHNLDYSPLVHNHTDYSLITHNHDTVYAPIVHTHDLIYSPVSHTHTISEITDHKEVEYTLIKDIRPLGEDGGTSRKKTWNVRVLNTIEYDPHQNVALVGDDFVLAQGTYRVHVSCPAEEVGTHKVRVFNETTEITEFEGQTMKSEDGGTASATGIIVSNGVDQFEVQHWTKDKKEKEGLGEASDVGDHEVYTVVEIIKLVEV